MTNNIRRATQDMGIDLQRVDKSDKRWLDDDIKEVFSGIVNYLKNIKIRKNKNITDFK